MIQLYLVEHLYQVLHQYFDLAYFEVLDLKEGGNVGLQLLLKSLSCWITTLVSVGF